MNEQSSYSQSNLFNLNSDKSFLCMIGGENVSKIVSALCLFSRTTRILGYWEHISSKSIDVDILRFKFRLKRLIIGNSRTQ